MITGVTGVAFYYVLKYSHLEYYNSYKEGLGRRRVWNAYAVLYEGIAGVKSISFPLYYACDRGTSYVTLFLSFVWQLPEELKANNGYTLMNVGNLNFATYILVLFRKNFLTWILYLLFTTLHFQ